MGWLVAWRLGEVGAGVEASQIAAHWCDAYTSHGSAQGKEDKILVFLSQFSTVVPVVANSCLRCNDAGDDDAAGLARSSDRDPKNQKSKMPVVPTCHGSR